MGAVRCLNDIGIVSITLRWNDGDIVEGSWSDGEREVRTWTTDEEEEEGEEGGGEEVEGEEEEEGSVALSYFMALRAKPAKVR